MRILIGLLLSLLLLLTGCLNEAGTMMEADYEQTKKMVIDILKTSEGQEALQELLAKDEMKENLILQSDVVKETIKEELASEAGMKMWKKLFADSDFIKVYADLTSSKQEALFKGLMVDADFQKQFIDLLQNPEITKQTLTMLKSQQFREHLEKVIEETLDSPLFQEKIEKSLSKVTQQDAKKDEEESSEEEEK